METLKREYTEDTSKVQPLRFFCAGDAYLFWGMIPLDFHLVCPAEGGTLFLLGTDRLGRDVLSRMIYGARISLTIGLVGIAFSFMLGISIGGVAGYYGGWIDSAVQRLIEIVRSFPEIPLWLALSAILPVTWSPLWVFFGITLILALLDWPGLARAVRSKLLSLREEDFTTAAQLMGASPKRIIFRHLMPSFSSHLIASLTLSIPSMILAETALSFLGLGLRPPITSWGVLLTEAQNINAVELYPWLLLPAVPVIVTVLAFNFLGDGLLPLAPLPLPPRRQEAPGADQAPATRTPRPTGAPSTPAATRPAAAARPARAALGLPCGPPAARGARPPRGAPLAAAARGPPPGWPPRSRRAACPRDRGRRSPGARPAGLRPAAARRGGRGSARPAGSGDS